MNELHALKKSRLLVFSVDAVSIKTETFIKLYVNSFRESFPPTYAQAVTLSAGRLV